MLVGSIGYTVPSGLGHLVRDFHRNGIIDRVYRIPHPRYPERREWYSPENLYDRTAGHGATEFLDGLTHLLIFENTWSEGWGIVEEAKRRGVKFVLCPMYEWTPRPLPVSPDLVICPSLLDVEYFRDLPNVFLTVPVAAQFRLREKVVTFRHNAGHGQVGFAKGTPEVIKAIAMTKTPARFIITGQPEEQRTREIPALAAAAGLRQLGSEDSTVTLWEIPGNPEAFLKIVIDNLPEEKLFDEGSVYVNAERYNGLSLPLQEAYASGMVVMTTDRFPANAWLPREPLIKPHAFDRHRVNSTWFERAYIDPATIAAKIDEWYGRDICALSLAGGAWGKDNGWAVLGPKWKAAIAGV